MSMICKTQELHGEAREGEQLPLSRFALDWKNQTKKLRSWKILYSYEKLSLTPEEL